MKILSLLALSFVLFSCNKTKVTKLDPSTVKYQMTATVNGKSWTSASFDNSNAICKWSKDSTRFPPIWKITGQNLNTNEVLELDFMSNSFSINYDYYLSIPLYAGQSGYIPQYSYLTLLYGGSSSSNLNFPNQQARIRFTKFDGEKMSGTFDFKMGRYVSPGVWDSVVVSNGVFTDITR